MTRPEAERIEGVRVTIIGVESDRLGGRTAFSASIDDFDVVDFEVDRLECARLDAKGVDVLGAFSTSCGADIVCLTEEGVREVDRVE